jgi:hypothetical protein
MEFGEKKNSTEEGEKGKRTGEHHGAIFHTKLFLY